jgi:SAM-dependent methyltransferase
MSGGPRFVMSGAVSVESTERRWGEGKVDLASRDLAALKARHVLENLPEGQGLSVLDYGCGEGKLLALVGERRPGWDLVGVDIQKPLASDHFRFHLLEAGRPPPLADGAFDAVVSVDVLEHVLDLDETLAQIARLLKPGGRLVGFVPIKGQPFSPYAFFRRLFGKDLYARTKDHVQAYRRREFVERLSRHFRVEKVNFSYHVPGTLMDATFFALCAIPAVGRWWWRRSNPIYRPTATRGLFGWLMVLANRLCYLESSLLFGVSLFSSGLHFVAIKPR